MSSLTTEQQRDDLAARRRRKQAQETAAPNGDAVAALQSSQAARGLIRDVITGIPDQTPAGAGLEEGVSHTRARETDRPDSPPRVPTSRAVTSDGERVDELVRRVKEGASAASAEAIASGAHSRPKGTADLAADAAVKGRYRQLPITRLAALVAREASSDSLVGSSCRRARRRTRGDRAGGRQLR